MRSSAPRFSSETRCYSVANNSKKGGKVPNRPRASRMKATVAARAKLTFFPRKITCRMIHETKKRITPSRDLPVSGPAGFHQLSAFLIGYEASANTVIKPRVVAPIPPAMSDAATGPLGRFSLRVCGFVTVVIRLLLISSQMLGVFSAPGRFC